MYNVIKNNTITDMKNKSQKVAINKRARFDYHIDDTFEAGIVLQGSEIKSIRERQVTLVSSYCKILSGKTSHLELFLIGCSIGDKGKLDPQRTRKLLVHKKQLNNLIGLTQQKGKTLIPLSMYMNNGKAKLEVGIGSGKKNFDKRLAIKLKDIKRDIEYST